MVYRDFRIRTIETGRVVARQTVVESTESPTQPVPTPPPSKPVPTPPPPRPSPIPNCFLNDAGEVVCQY